MNIADVLDSEVTEITDNNYVRRNDAMWAYDIDREIADDMDSTGRELQFNNDMPFIEPESTFTMKPSATGMYFSRNSH